MTTDDRINEGVTKTADKYLSNGASMFLFVAFAFDVGVIPQNGLKTLVEAVDTFFNGTIKFSVSLM